MARMHSSQVLWHTVLTDVCPLRVVLIRSVDVYRYPYEHDLIRYLRQLIDDMDRKIKKAKERAAAESAPKELRADDKKRLEEIEIRIKGRLVVHCKLAWPAWAKLAVKLMCH